MIRNLRSRALAVLFSLMLCLGLTPATALAAGEDAPDKLYVGNQSVRNGDSTTYWITNDSGKLTRSSENDTWSVKYEPGTATLTLKGATIDGGEYSTPHYGAGIYAQCSSNQSVTLTIELIGTNTITGNYGIYVDAQQGGERRRKRLPKDHGRREPGSFWFFLRNSGQKRNRRCLPDHQRRVCQSKHY